jgi:nicotinate-nucleotide pyrophosphorylase (carboxylating)
LAEDLGPGDVTSRLVVPGRALTAARLVARSSGVLCGIRVCRRVFQAVSRRVEFQPLAADGERFRPGRALARIWGPARSLLAAERTALNFIQRMSGVASLTARYVAAVWGTGVRILDTRKTVPGWRELDKYAVRRGGGSNHRRGLYDMILIKDNHVAAAGSIADAVGRCRRLHLPVEVECRTLADVEEALASDCRRILLDNMTPAQMRAAVRLGRRGVRFEASGGITLDNVRRVARTGVSRISVGALTHSAPAADIALEFDVRE